jgi:hypothetical protein
VIDHPAFLAADFSILKAAVYAAVNSDGGDSDRGRRPFHRAVENLAEQGAPHSHIAEMYAWETSCLLCYSRADEVSADAARMAAEQGLVYFDPQ